MLDGGQFIPGLSGGESSQPLGRPGRGGRGEALSAQRLGGLHLSTQTSGTLRPGCAQGPELFGGRRVREVRGPETTAARVTDADLVIVVRHIAHRDGTAGLSGHPRCDAGAPAPPHAMAGQLPRAAVVLEGERPQAGGGHVRDGSRIGLPCLKRSLSPQRFGTVLGIPPLCPVQHLRGEVLKRHGTGRLRPAARVFASPAGAGLGGGEGAAGQGREQHPVDGPVEVLHRALEMRAAGGKILHPHAHRAERRGDGGRQEVLAPVHPHLLRCPSRRAAGLRTQNSGAQRDQHGGAGRNARSDRDAGDGVGGAVGEPRHPRAHQVTAGIDQQRCLDMIGLPHVIAPRGRPFAEDVLRACRIRPRGKTRPLPHREITTHRAQKRRQRRHRVQQRHRSRQGARGRSRGLRRRRRLTVTTAGLGPGHQLTVDRRSAAAPARQHASSTRISPVTSNLSPLRSPGRIAARGDRKASASHRHTIRSHTPKHSPARRTCSRDSRRSARSASRRRTAGARNTVNDSSPRTPARSSGGAIDCPPTPCPLRSHPFP